MSFENGFNLYSYVLNDPLIKLDYYGLEVNTPIPITQMGPVSIGVTWNNTTLETIQQNNIQSVQGNYQSVDLEELKRRMQLNRMIMSNSANEFMKNILIEGAEVNLGKEFKAPTTKSGAYGRILGRNIFKLLGDVSYYSGFIMTGAGTMGAPVGALVTSTGALAIPGAITTAASGGLITAGMGAIYYGKNVRDNYNKLSEVEIPDGKGGINIVEGSSKYGMKHAMERHKFYAKEIDVSKFNKSMNKYDVKRLIQNGWKSQPKRLIKDNGFTQEWNIEMSKPIGFGKRGGKTRILKIIIDKNSNKLITAYPY